MPYLNNDGVRIYYRTEGAGSPVVLVHGKTCSMEDWREFGYVDALKPSHQLVLMDYRGHGHSDIVAVLDALDIRKAHYVGYSMGGWFGFGIAKHAQDRVLSLALGGVHPYEDTMADARAGWIGKSAGDVLAMSESRGITYSAERRIRFLANDPIAQAAILPNANNEDVLAGIKVPCLVYCGDADPWHTLAKKAAAAIKGATFVSLPGLNHWAGFTESQFVLPRLKELFK